MTHHIPKVALVTYNPIPPYLPGIMTINTTEVFIASEIFSPKSINNIRNDDPLFKELIKYSHSLERIYIFAGKKSSGGVAMIELFASQFGAKKDILHFILCDHDLAEKIAVITRLGFTKEQYMTFSDNHTQCQEGPILKGYMLNYLEQR